MALPYRSCWRVLAPVLLCAPLTLAGPGWAQGPGPGASALPALGDTVSQDLSPSSERRLGDRIMRSILRDPDVVDDPLVREYIDQVWQRLLASARLRGEISPELQASHAWEPFLVRDRSVNAFALPGGYIGVHLGLLAMTSSPDELASVLAHEMAHVTQRHIARMIAQQSRQSWVSLASIVLGILAASRNAAAGQALIYGGQAAVIQGQLNFSRDMEREADRVGFGVLDDAGFAPSGMALMFEHLQQASRLNDDGSFPYLRTHPLTTERIGEARARLGPQGWQVARQGVQDEHTQSALWAQHTLMAARAQVLMDTRSVARQNLLQAHVKPDASALQTVAAHYSSALAWQEAADLVRARAAFNEARLSAKALPAAQQMVVARVLALSQAEGLLKAQQGEQAAALLARELGHQRMSPRLDARPELLLAAQVAISLPAGQAADTALQDAAARLQTQVSLSPRDASAWSTLSAVWQRLGQPLRAVRAEAEATAALGDIPGAIERIQGAQKRFRQPDAADVIELSVMDARLKTWLRQQRDDMREEGGS